MNYSHCVAYVLKDVLLQQNVLNRVSVQPWDWGLRLQLNLQAIDRN